MTPSEIVLHYVCPGLGAVIAFFLFLSPLKSVREVDRRQALGDMNALPFAMMSLNCIGWQLYGFLIRDWFVYTPNFVGLMAGFYYAMICYKYSKPKAQDTLTYLFMAGFAAVFIVATVDMATIDSPGATKTLWGSLCVAVLLVYYAAPMATLYKVVKERNSASLHWLLCLMNTINGGLWFAYGLAIRDWFIAVPNGLGAVFNIICLGFCIALPRGPGGSLKDDLRHPPALGANWGGIRLQSARFPASVAPGGADDGDGAPGLAGRQLQPAPSFLDITRFRWRSGTSFKKVASVRSASSLAALHEGADASDLEAGGQGGEITAAALGAKGPPHGGAGADAAAGGDGASSSRGSGDGAAPDQAPSGHVQQ